MIREFGRALSEALADKAEAHDALRRIQREGYSLFILLDGDGTASLDARPRSERPGDLPRLADGETARGELSRRPTGNRPPSGPPSFRIDRDDLTFLRSIGIDPTRKVRTRRDGRARTTAPDGRDIDATAGDAIEDNPGGG